MLYLSEIIGKKILDPHDNCVARVRDLVAEVLETEGSGNKAEVVYQPSVGKEQEETIEYDAPVIKGVLASAGRKSPPVFLQIKHIKALEPGIIRLRSSRVALNPYKRGLGEILLTRDLWDKQVIDLETRRVVRVNDVVITNAPAPPSASAEPHVRWWVRGVDVGLGGLARRLHIAWLLQNVRVGAHGRAPLQKALQPRIVRWSHLDVFGSAMQGGVDLPHKKLSGLHPVEIARITDAVSYHQGAEIIASLDDTLAADTLEEIVAERQTDIVESMPEDRAADILEEMAPDEATDLLSELPEDKAGALLEQMDEEEAQEVRQLMRYQENTAGGIMTTDFVRALPTMTVDEIIEANRQVFMSADLIYYVYIVDSEQDPKLLGIITVRDLLVHERDEVVSDFMLKEFLSVRPGENEREVARKMAEYNLLALPVVEKNGTLLGVVTVDDALDALLPEGWQKRIPRIFS
jgi:magnesium transporter